MYGLMPQDNAFKSPFVFAVEQKARDLLIYGCRGSPRWKHASTPSNASAAARAWSSPCTPGSWKAVYVTSALSAECAKITCLLTITIHPAVSSVGVTMNILEDANHIDSNIIQ